MNTKKNKKKDPILERKNLVVLGIAASVVILFAIVMTMFAPNEENIAQNQSFDSSAWEASVEEARQKIEAADSGMTSVYNEPSVATVADSEETTVEEVPEDSADNNVGTSDAENQQMQPGVFTIVLPVQGGVINDYSGDELVYSQTMDDWRTHNGIDFAADEGTDVLAAADGTVESITDNGMFGRTVVIVHDGGIRTIYSNLADGNEVTVGDNVLQGTVIGRVGNTAAAEAAEQPHLHFEVSRGEEPVNPHDYLPQMEETE